MRTILQQRDKDCGVACVAMLAGIPYAEAHEALAAEGRTAMVRAGQIKEALLQFGRKARFARAKSIKDLSLNSLDSDALLSAWLLEGRERFRHWVVWDHKHRKIRDPIDGDHKLVIRAYMPIDTPD